MKQKFLTTIALAVIPLLAAAQPKPDYYTSAKLDGKNGRELELALKEIVYPHTKVSYNSLWKHYETTDPGPSDSIPATATKRDLVYDMYAWMSQFPKFYQDNDHSQTSGINREHCVPNSWWGAEKGNPEAYTDLHHLVPSDGAANNAKNDHALGEFKTGMTLAWPKEPKHNSDGYTYVYADTHEHVEGVECTACASHVWEVNPDEYGGDSRLFEPANEYKGDFARMYLYVVCAYEGELEWKVNYMFDSDAQRHTTIKDWARDLLLKWHRQDPISDKERARNNAVESIQNNRNPFIDYPELVEYIWGNKSSENFSLTNAISAYSDEYKNGVINEEDDITKVVQAPAIVFTFRTTLAQGFTGKTVSANSGGTVTYRSSNSAVAEVDAQTGAVTLKKVGSVIITATVAETDDYNAGSLSYQIIIEE
ncbi:MAG: endonuclease [Prevotellaceae bacterium]|nr:endonuclease [Prevotellaceae bacterium]